MTVIPINGHDPNATVTSEEVAEAGATRGRAPAREEAPNATPAPVANATPADRDRAAEFVALVRPPDLWSVDRPSLQKVWNYALYAPWTDQSRTTAARAAGVAYGTVAVALTAVGYSLLWVIERPARLAVAGLLATLVGLSWLI